MAMGCAEPASPTVTKTAADAVQDPATGHWTISYDGGKTSERILDAAGDPVSAVTEGSSIGSLFKSVNYDDNNVYFELVDGTIITISKTGSQSSNIIIFADKDVKKRCVGLWDTNGDGELSHEEVAAVTTIGTVFQNNTDIEFFNEFFVRHLGAYAIIDIFQRFSRGFCFFAPLVLLCFALARKSMLRLGVFRSEIFVKIYWFG